MQKHHDVHGLQHGSVRESAKKCPGPEAMWLNEANNLTATTFTFQASLLADRGLQHSAHTRMHLPGHPDRRSRRDPSDERPVAQLRRALGTHRTCMRICLQDRDCLSRGVSGGGC